MRSYDVLIGLIFLLVIGTLIAALITEEHGRTAQKLPRNYYVTIDSTYVHVLRIEQMLKERP